MARLYTDGEFLKRIGEQFEGDWKLRFHLAPPLFARRGPDGHLVKKAYGPGMLRVFRLLARCKRLRGTRLDPFGYTRERRAERELAREYRETLTAILSKLNRGNLDLSLIHISPRAMTRCASESLAATMAAANAVRSKLPKSACTK